jgi:hypothetical protein
MMKRLVINFHSIRIGSKLIKLPCGDRYIRIRDRFDVSLEFRHCRVKFAYEYPNPRERLRFFPREYLLPSEVASETSELLAKTAMFKVREAAGAGRRQAVEASPSIQHRFREVLGKTRLLHRVG